MNKRGQLYNPQVISETDVKKFPTKTLIALLLLILLLSGFGVWYYLSKNKLQQKTAQEIVETCVRPCITEGNSPQTCAITCKIPMNLSSEYVSLCGDGICNSVERAHSLLCPKDCINKSFANVSCVNGFEYSSSTNTCQAKNVKYICLNGTLNNSTNLCEVNAPTTNICSQGNYNSVTGYCEVSANISYICSQGTLMDIEGTKYCVEYINSTDNITSNVPTSETQKNYSVFRTTQTIYNLSYGSDSSAQQLDLYFPTNLASNQTVPLIIEIHGGGFEGGDKLSNLDYYRKTLPSYGYAVAELNYRLANRANKFYTYPLAVYDVKSAIRWLRANANNYGFDSNNFGLIGGSAGGYFVSFLGTTGDMKTWDVGNNLEYSSEVQAVISQYGISNFSSYAQDVLDSLGHPMPNEADVFLGCILKDNQNATCKNKMAEASPVTYISSNDPPFFIIYGSADNMIPPVQSKELYAALQKAGVTSSITEISGAGHGGQAFNEPYINQYIAFFDKYLKN